MVLVTSHRRENQGKPQEHICSALLELVRRFPDILVVFPVHLSPAVRDTVLPRLKEQDRIVLLDPVDYFETVHFMKASHIVLTDSGGIQEEAPALGKPVLVLRETPISLVHARAITQVIEAGALVMPASPSFYSGPRTIEALVDTVVARVLDRLGLPNELMKRWTGLSPKAAEPAEEG